MCCNQHLTCRTLHSINHRNARGVKISEPDIKTGEQGAKPHRVGAAKTNFQKITMDHRRTIISMLYLSGNHTLASIKDYLKENYGISCAISNLSVELKKMRVQWRAEYLKNTEQHVMSELSKLNTLEECAMNGLMATGLTADYIKAMLAIKKRRANLMGLDKAIKVEVSSDPSNLSDQQLDAVIAMATEKRKKA